MVNSSARISPKVPVGAVLMGGLRLYFDSFQGYYGQAMLSSLWFALATVITVLVRARVTAIAEGLPENQGVGLHILGMGLVAFPWAY